MKPDPTSSGPLAPAIAAGEGLLAAAPIAQFAIDRAGRICLWNDAAAELYGWSADEMLGTLPPFIGPTHIDDALATLDSVLRGATIERRRFRFLRRDGEAFDGLASASPLTDGDGPPLAALVLVRDVSVVTRAERDRSAAEQKWRRLALQAVDSVSFADREGHVLATAHGLGDALGYHRDQWSGRSGFELLHPDDVGRAAELWAGIADAPGETRREVLRARHADGHYEQVEFTAVNLLHDPNVASMVVACRMVSTERQNARLVADEAAVLELIARDAPMDDIWRRIVGMVEYHTDGVAGIFLYEEGENRLRLQAGSGAADPVRTIPGSDDAGMVMTDGDLVTIRQTATVLDLATDARTKHWGGRFADAGYPSAWTQPIIETTSSAVRGSLGVFVRERRSPTRHELRVAEVASHLVAVELERSGWQCELHRRARSDELTGLPNRTAIFEQLDATLADARVRRLPVTAMVIDIDRFKVINDSLGHDAGDELLRAFAVRLHEVMGDRGFVGRMAADEFVVIFSPGVRLREAKLAGRNLTRALEKPFHDDIHLTVSAGLAMSTLGRENADALLQRADAAMFRAKGAGRDRVEVYDERLRTRTVKRLEIDRELRVALERGELQLYYQPEIDCRTERVVGAEALLRWEHPQRGLIHPEGFINVAEESGIIVPIGHWVMDEAVRQARTWTDAHPHIDPFSISVNLSARQLINRSLVDTVAFVLTRYDWPPSNLTLELTESILIEDRDATLYVLNRLRMLGVKLAIDDFGTGFASLDYLHRLHVDWIKIDRSFVRMLDAEGNGSPVATAMMHMARAFDLGVIAEGVEEQRQVDGLRALGCDILQGFLFAKPLRADDMEHFLMGPPHPAE